MARMRILLVEDNRDHAELIRRAFEVRSGGETEIVSTRFLKDARAIIQSDPPDLVITDFRLPDGLGTEILEKNNDELSFPVVIISSQGDESIAVEALKSGAIDYVVKSEKTLSELPQIAERVSREWSLIKGKMEAEKDLIRHLDRLRLLNTMTRKIGGILDVNTTLGYVLSFAASMLPATSIGLFLLDKDSYQLRAAEGNFPEEIFSPGSASYDNLVKGVAEEKMLVCVDQVPGLRPLIPGRENAAGSSWCVSAPLLGGEGVSGVLVLVSDTADITREDEQEIIQAIANSAAVAFQNAEVHGRLKMAVDDLKKSQQLVTHAERLSSIGVLAAGAAHEILNPATIIQIRSELLLEQMELGSPQREMTQTILDSVERIKRICHDLRKFSRNERIQKIHLSLNDLIRETIALYSPEFKFSSIVPIIELHDEDTSILGDSQQLQQVLINLFNNARDAMQDGGAIVVECRDKEMGGKKWKCLTVMDTGTGMNEELKKQIFDPFFTTKEKNQGTGLGLSVLHGIVSNHEGKIVVESEPGKGSAFSIYFPLVQDTVSRGDNLGKQA